MSKLTFKSSKTLRAIAEHTLKAETYSNPYGMYSEMETVLHLDLVKDSGIYIMSGSSDNFKTRKNQEGSMVAYAVGYNPKTNENCWEDARLAVGGDDFFEPVPMVRDQLERIADGGSLSIDITKDSIVVKA